MANATKSTIEFPIAYTQVPSVIGQSNWNNGSELIYPSRFPHTVTVTDFTRSKGTSAIRMSWISIGY